MQARTHFDHYRLDAELGSGGMGIVYKATDEKLNREVAIKVLHPHLLKNQELKERFHREARVHASLMHPNVVTLLSLFEEGDDVALVMEMVHGKDLKQYMKAHNPLPIQEILRIAKEILAGLGAAHQMGLVHRDLKPANVLIAESGMVKLMDFGLAKLTSGDDDLTQSGATVGSFRYMAPEQIMHTDIDSRTDLYAFGILLYQMVTGKLPFDATADGGGEFQIMEQQVRADPIPPIEVNKDMPPALSDLILRLLAKKPDDRPSTCADVSASIQRIEQALTLEQSQVHVHQIPVNSGQTQSNIEIASDLAAASFAKLREAIEEASKSLAYAPVKFGDSVIEQLPFETHVAANWKTKWTMVAKLWISWGVVVFFAALLGVASMGVMSLAEQSENNSKTQQQNKKPMTQEKIDLAERKTDVEAAKQAKLVQDKYAEMLIAKAKAEQEEAIKEAKKRAEQAKKKIKKVVKKTYKPRAKPATYQVPHEVRRSNYTKAKPDVRHEYKGGSYLFFKELASYRWKEKLHTFKTGKSRLVLKKPVSPGYIVLRKASVGRADFDGGYVRLYVQNMDGDWLQVFERKNDDVDIPVSIPSSKLPKQIKGIKIQFKTPEPITIGPIDLFAKQ